VSETNKHRVLSEQEVQALTAQGCTAEDWSSVKVADPFDPSRVRDVRFEGSVRIGSLAGTVTGASGLDRPCGIHEATLINCTVGDGVRIARIGSHIANYTIGDGACIEDVGVLQTNPGAAFGNGTEVEVLNEGGGREVALFNNLSSQFAHLLCMHRYRPKFIERLEAFAKAQAEAAGSDTGTIGAGAKVAAVARIIDVNIGDAATVWGASALENGTVLSNADAPTLVGDGVQAHDFIIGEASKVTQGAIVAKTFVGQGCQVGKQFSAEGSLFFANCEAFHGEACSIFAGPYTVTHHKSTLLIAGLFSFYNAGSGTNQSNHMYKLGPVHEGKLERGCKTGSFSYMMWPCRVGPFTVILGKHTRTFDLSDFPFSHIEAAHDGRCMVIPGLNLSTVGTVRDGAKWPTRDRRKGKVKRDRISFDVFSPLTVGRMIAGSDRLQELQDNTDKSVDTVTISGAQVKRVLLRGGLKHYRSGIHTYLLEKVVSRIERAVGEGGGGLGEAMAASPDAVYSEQWVDIGGQMMPRQRLEDLYAAVESGRIADLAGFEAALDAIHDAYSQDEWAWVRQAYRKVFGVDLDTVQSGDAAAIADSLLAAQSKFLGVIQIDAGKEFGESTQTGFGQDGSEADRSADFQAVRGEFETNKFVKQIKQDAEDLGTRIERLKQALAVNA
jgi:Domain of unknown function (DUF4954)/Domain of unknown function (DUF6819)